MLSLPPRLLGPSLLTQAPARNLRQREVLQA